MNVLDERGDRLIVSPATVAQAVEDVRVHGVVVPVVARRAADRAVEIAVDDLDARLDESAREEKLLPPTVAPVAVARAVVFLGEVEGVAGLRIREQRHGLPFKLVERAEFTFLVEAAFQRVEILERPAIIGTGVGLRIVGVDVRQPTDEPDHDDGGAFLLRLGGILGAQAQQPRQAEGGEAGEADAHEAAPRKRARTAERRSVARRSHGEWTLVRE